METSEPPWFKRGPWVGWNRRFTTVQICGYSGSKGTAIRNFDGGEISIGTVRAQGPKGGARRHPRWARLSQPSDQGIGKDAQGTLEVFDALVPILVVGGSEGNQRGLHVIQGGGQMLAFKGSAQVIFLIHLSFPALPGNTTKQGPFIKLPMKIFPTEPPGKIFDGGTNLSEISEPPFLTIVPFEPSLLSHHHPI